MPLPQDRLYAIFVSSTSDDLEKYRQTAREVILDKKCLPVMMEHFSAESKSTTGVIEKYLRNCDAVILIAGARYGSTPHNTEKSYVEWEFEQADKKGLPIVSVILSEDARASFADTDPEQQSKQARFIERLEQRYTRPFNDTNYYREIGKAVDGLITQLNDQQGSGFIKVADHDVSVKAKSEELHRSNTRGLFLRMLSSFALLRQNCLDRAHQKESVMSNGHERDIVNKLLDLVHHDMFDQPVTAKIAAKLMSRFIERLHNFSEPAGFTPDSVQELGIALDELFGDTLTLLQATSIHSNHKDLASYKGYWEDNVLGPFFKKKNKEFLSRPGSKIKRIYVCDSLSDVLAEKWFSDTVVQHVREGALVRVVQVTERYISQYEDFGIYEHSGNSDAYLLLAPKEKNVQEKALRTAVSADPTKVSEYKRKFEKMWSQSNETLEIVSSPQTNEADQQSLGIHGEGAINDLFDQHVILRRMQRLDTNECLLPENAHSVRKYQREYADALSNHIKNCFPTVEHLFYIGDTYKNDGTAIRNLQALDWDVTGFICEPKLKIEGLWFNSILYTNRWIDLIDYAARVREKVGPKSLALFDIDQTLWAPKGIHDSPLNRARTQAIKNLIDDYVDPGSPIANSAKARIELLYNEISEVKYLNSLTLDNEDYKAAICVFLSLNAIWNQPEIDRGDTDQGAAFFQRYHEYSPAKFLEFLKTEYLPKFLNPGQPGETNITHFMLTTVGTVKTHQFDRYGNNNNIKVQSVQNDVEGIFREMVGARPVKYQAFRAKELQESLSRIAGEFDDRLVLNKPAWDLASWMKQRGVEMLGLSDRPDEATFVPNGDSLLNAKMMIYGKPIAQILN
jgi:hypothetical protein